MIIKRYFISVICFFLAFSISAQEFSRTFKATYPVFGFDLLGYSTSPTANALVNTENLLSITNEKGSAKATIESKSIKNGIFSITILLVINGKKAARIQYSLQSDDFSEQNYLTYLRFVNFNSGISQIMEYDGYSQESLGEILGGFSGLVKLFYNTNKLLVE